MLKPELSALVDSVMATWGTESTDKLVMYRTWWRYLSDVDAADVTAVIDQRVLAGERWMPRVGDVRQAAMDRASGKAPLPDAERTWALAAARFSATDMGTDAASSGDDELDEMIGEAMRRAGGSDKRAFAEAWAGVREEAIAIRYALPEDAPELIK